MLIQSLVDEAIDEYTRQVAALQIETLLQPVKVRVVIEDP